MHSLELEQRGEQRHKQVIRTVQLFCFVKLTQNFSSQLLLQNMVSHGYQMSLIFGYISSCYEVYLDNFFLIVFFVQKKKKNNIKNEP